MWLLRRCRPVCWARTRTSPFFGCSPGWRHPPPPGVHCPPSHGADMVHVPVCMMCVVVPPAWINIAPLRFAYRPAPWTPSTTLADVAVLCTCVLASLGTWGCALAGCGRRHGCAAIARFPTWSPHRPSVKRAECHGPRRRRPLPPLDQRHPHQPRRLQPLPLPLPPPCGLAPRARSIIAQGQWCARCAAPCGLRRRRLPSTSRHPHLRPRRLLWPHLHRRLRCRGQVRGGVAGLHFGAPVELNRLPHR
jgi:hypothetical protein